MRPILILTVTAALLLPGAALAFDLDTASPKNPDGSARFSDPDEAPALPGLQVLGATEDNASPGGLYIPQSPASSDQPALFYSSPASRSR